MSCVPGMPCYGPEQTGCGVDPCLEINIGTDNVRYTGPNLPCSGIHTCDDLSLILQKLDEKICELQACCAGTTSTTTTSSTSTSTTTTTTTACPCLLYTFYGSRIDSATFEFTPCGENYTITIDPGDTQAIYSVSTAHPITKTGTGGGYFSNEVCSSCQCYYVFVSEIGIIPGTLAWLDCYGTPQQQTISSVGGQFICALGGTVGLVLVEGTSTIDVVPAELCGSCTTTSTTSTTTSTSSTTTTTSTSSTTTTTTTTQYGGPCLSYFVHGTSDPSSWTATACGGGLVGGFIGNGNTVETGCIIPPSLVLNNAYIESVIPCTTTTTSTSSTTTTTTTEFPCICTTYIVSNDSGIPVWLYYRDCNGVLVSHKILNGIDALICACEDTITYTPVSGFAIGVDPANPCTTTTTSSTTTTTTPYPCECYNVTNTGDAEQGVVYSKCGSGSAEDILTPGVPLFICVNYGTVPVSISPDVVITRCGLSCTQDSDCDGCGTTTTTTTTAFCECHTYTLQNTSSLLDFDVFYTDCNGGAQFVNILQDATVQVCACVDSLTFYDPLGYLNVTDGGIGCITTTTTSTSSTTTTTEYPGPSCTYYLVQNVGPLESVTVEWEDCATGNVFTQTVFTNDYFCAITGTLVTYYGAATVTALGPC